MGKVVLSHSALKDLASIMEYISVDSEFYAKQVIQRIFLRITTLETHPKIGRVVPEFSDPTLREMIDGNYRIIYKVAEDGPISVVRIYHRSRLLRTL